MDYKIDKKTPSTLFLHVELDSNDLKSFIAKAEAKIAEGLHLKGFRKGKAPADVVKNAVGLKAIQDEALQIAVGETLSNIASKEKIRLIKQENFSLKENTSEKLVYELDLIIFPEIELGDYSNIEVERKKIVVSDEDVKKVLIDIAKLRTEGHSVERKAGEGDRVTIDFIIKNDGTEVAGGNGQDYPVVIGSGQFIPEFEDQLIGLGAGDNKDFNINVKDDFPEKSIAGKSLDCSVTVHLVEELTMPQIDDQLAKSIGNFGSLADLEENIKNGLKLEKERKESDKVNESILKNIIAKSKIEAPEYLINQKLDEMMQSFDRDLHSRGMELSLYLAHIKKTQDDMRTEWRPKAVELVSMGLVLQEIGHREGVKVTDAEIDNQMQIELQHYMAHESKELPAQALNSINVDILKEDVASNLYNKKILALLNDRAKIKEVE